MRIIKYPITLQGGYNFLNDPKATEVDDQGDPCGISITMTILERFKPKKHLSATEKSKVIDAFIYDADDMSYN